MKDALSAGRLAIDMRHHLDVTSSSRARAAHPRDGFPGLSLSFAASRPRGLLIVVLRAGSAAPPATPCGSEAGAVCAERGLHSG